MRIVSRLITILLVLSTAGYADRAAAQTTAAHSFGVGKGCFELDGKPFVIRAAELHYPRIPRPYWQHRLRMCKSLGMNAVCLYVFWNLHEPQPGVFDFEGNNDVAEFCRLAQKEGLWVILRPGPYVCAEWEMGGLPWWLLRHEGVTLRDDDEPYFLERVGIFEREVGRQLARLTIEHGGPIIMVQVENEYGSYAEDKVYVSKVRDTLREVGFDKVTLFQCDWASNFTKNGLDDLVWTMNFGTGADIDKQFSELKRIRPQSPLMCSEYWSGWFDKWGARHETRPAKKMVSGITDMLDRGISFSLYMTHGGTSYAHWAGANSPGFSPDVTSYDYDAPINEQGSATPKYHLLREALTSYIDGSLPAIPKALPTMNVDTFRFDRYAPLEAGSDSIIRATDPLTFEQIGMGHGIVIYEATMPDMVSTSTLEANDLHDYASVYVDGILRGRLDRASGKKSMLLPPVKKGSKLTLVVEAMGRINFGRAIADYKGITKNVTLRTVEDGHYVSIELKNWTMRPIDYSYATASRATKSATTRRESSEGGSAGYYATTLRLKKTADTWFDMRHWGKGMLYVNGHAIGRFWAEGPQQTLFVPGCWLQKGDNEIIVADAAGPRRTICWATKEAQLDLLQPGIISSPDRELSADGIVQRPSFCDMRPALDTELAAGTDLKTIAIKERPRGRYVAIEIASTHDGEPASIAEINIQTEGGRLLPREEWRTVYVSSEEMSNGNNSAEKAFDMQETTAWQTTGPVGDKPHLLVIDLGYSHRIYGITLLPAAYSQRSGVPRKVRIYIY